MTGTSHDFHRHNFHRRKFQRRTAPRRLVPVVLVAVASSWLSSSEHRHHVCTAFTPDVARQSNRVRGTTTRTTLYHHHGGTTKLVDKVTTATAPTPTTTLQNNDNNSVKTAPTHTPARKQQRNNTMWTRGPWLASYHTSRKTQERIQKAGTVKGWHPLRRAIHVLQTLFEKTHADHCNAANLVCALTLTAKIRSNYSAQSYADQHKDATAKLRRYLWQAIAVLRLLNDNDQLSARQLCNAVWALAKHYDRDALILPSPNKQTALSSDKDIGTAEEWSLREDLDPAQVTDQVVDELAVNLAQKLRDNPWIAKEGELCMAYWAYGVLRERRRPAGWKLAPQVGLATKVPNKRNSEPHSSYPTKISTVRFEQLQGFPRSTGGKSEECLPVDPVGPTDELFDQIALSLCLPIQTNTLESTTTTAHRVAPLRLQTCRWSELSHVAWAHASHGWSCSPAAESVLLAVASEAARRLHSPHQSNARPLSRDMAQLVWSMGILQADNFRLTSGLVELLNGVATYTRIHNSGTARPFQDWSCADIVQVPLALAHARIDNQDLLRELYSEASERLSSTTRNQKHRDLYAWEVSILLWAQARLHLTGEQGAIFDEFPRKAVDFLLNLSENRGDWVSIGIGAQEQANLIWSMTVLEQFDANKSIRLLQELFRASQEECRETNIIQLEHAHQLWQALFILEEEAPTAVKGVEPWFRETLEAKWLQEKARPKASSARHKALSKVLTDMGVAHFNEHDQDIDVAIVLKRAASWTHETDRVSLDGGMKVAVEFDGPNHFTRILDTSKREAPRSLGHSVLKYRLLKRQGWTVVRVPYYEFDRIPFWASMERQRYVQRLLKTHSDLRFSSVDVSEYAPPVANRHSRYQ